MNAELKLRCREATADLEVVAGERGGLSSFFIMVERALRTF